MAYGVVLFHTTSSAMRAERLVIEEGLPIKLIPTPRQFSSDCGIALRFDWSQLDHINQILETGNVEIDTVRFLDS